MGIGPRRTTLAGATSFFACVVLASVAHAAPNAEPLEPLPPAEGPPRAPSKPEPPVVVVSPPPPEAAPPEPARSLPGRTERVPVNGGFEVALGTLFFTPSLADTYFDGEGTPLNGTERQTFHHKGRELGLESPLMWGAELSLHYLRRYFAVGVLGFAAGHPGAADAEPIPAGAVAPTQVNQGALSSYGGAIDVAAAVPYGILAIRPSTALGIRSFMVPMIGFEKRTCRGKRGNYPCYEYASTGAQIFFEPRLRLVVTPPRTSISFGAYVGVEVVGGFGPTAGLFFGFLTRSHEGLLP